MSPLKERSEILQEARNIGGRRLVLICEEIMDRTTVPIDETLALKFRNVGGGRGMKSSAGSVCRNKPHDRENHEQR